MMKEAEKCSSTCDRAAASCLASWSSNVPWGRGSLGAPGCHQGVGDTAFQGGMRICPHFLNQHLSGQSFNTNL